MVEVTVNSTAEENSLRLLSQLCPKIQEFGRWSVFIFMFVDHLKVLTSEKEKRRFESGTVKAGNSVTFFAQINFFLKNALR